MASSAGAEEETEQLIVSTPGICGGKPRIAGHRIRVEDVVLWKERRAMEPEQMMAEYPGLTLLQIEAALDYYANHPEEIRESLKKETEFADLFEKRMSSVFDRFRRAPDVKDDQVPSG